MTINNKCKHNHPSTCIPDGGWNWEAEKLTAEADRGEDYAEMVEAHWASLCEGGGSSWHVGPKTCLPEPTNGMKALSKLAWVLEQCPLGGSGIIKIKDGRWVGWEIDIMEATPIRQFKIPSWDQIFGATTIEPEPEPKAPPAPWRACMYRSIPTGRYDFEGNAYGQTPSLAAMAAMRDLENHLEEMMG